MTALDVSGDGTLQVEEIKELFSKLLDIPADEIPDDHDEVLEFAGMTTDEMVENLSTKCTKDQVDQYYEAMFPEEAVEVVARTAHILSEGDASLDKAHQRIEGDASLDKAHQGIATAQEEIKAAEEALESMEKNTPEYAHEAEALEAQKEVLGARVAHAEAKRKKAAAKAAVAGA